MEQNPQLKNQALIQKAQSLKQLKQYAEAIASLQRIPLFFLNDSTRSVVHFEKALCYYLNGDFTLTEFELRQLKEQQNAHYAAKHDILLALSLNEQLKWDDAKDILRSTITKSNFSNSQKDSLALALEE
ncbi:MAG TPA: tetratricopeptide repeat protein, partial [Tenuifilaceae bacterium]|nr:tetratricopeptide repeat protein [Tenuifilaceae bacterium]